MSVEGAGFGFVLLSISLFAINLSWKALCLAGSCVGFFVGICFSLTPGGGKGSDTLVAGHSAAMRC